MKIKIIETTISYYHDGKCRKRVEYSLKYQKSFLGIKYWKYYKTYIHYDMNRYMVIATDPSEEGIKAKFRQYLDVLNCNNIKNIVITKTDFI